MTRSDRLPETAWPWLHELSRAIGVGLRTIPYRVRFHGRGGIPRAGPLVLVANHSAMIDGPLLFSIVRRRSVFLIKHEMFSGFLAWYLPRIGQLAVRRGEADRAPLLTAVQVLRGGGLIGVFPEGTRGTGDMGTAHQGAAWLARMGDAPVVPLVMRGTRRPPGRHRRRFRPRVDVLVGAPLPPPTGRGREALAASTEQLRERLEELLDELDSVRVRQ